MRVFVLTKSFQQWHISSCLVQSNAGNTGPTESDWKLCAVNSFWGVLNAQPLLGLMEGLFSFFLLVSSAVSTVFPVSESQTLHPVALSFSHRKFKYVTHTHREMSVKGHLSQQMEGNYDNEVAKIKSN